MNITALYPGTFDPITNGHLDLIVRAAKLYPRVIVAIAANIGKNPLFSLAERVKLAATVTEGYAHIEVIGFEGLLAECAKQQGAQVILRGMRTVADFEYECQMASLNRHLAPDLETVFLMPTEQHTFISSSMIREIARYQGDVSGFVPGIVQQQLHAKFNQE
ncbi:pantetheine-phosphate adenylyltransferase [Crenothrix polyspora]|uniref:Phosphopantetheine adenylyltransferase n=1 Tax=Crenothrix polyspora TaxID=360316 RepID=A0A1R4H6W8_9GAMM|nr:pantetheine-phosphate adenylyltransferase [Crenothrix polyspora]SJM91907.1 pantetheine-phosphate adenylyltransferase [Crenothrix polyspora]